MITPVRPWSRGRCEARPRGAESWSCVSSRSHQAIQEEQTRDDVRWRSR